MEAGFTLNVVSIETREIQTQKHNRKPEHRSLNTSFSSLMLDDISGSGHQIVHSSDIYSCFVLYFLYSNIIIFIVFYNPLGQLGWLTLSQVLSRSWAQSRGDISLKAQLFREEREGGGGLRRTSTNRGMMKGSLMDPSPNVVEKATECDYEGLRC